MFRHPEPTTRFTSINDIATTNIFYFFYIVDLKNVFILALPIFLKKIFKFVFYLSLKLLLLLNSSLMIQIFC